MTMNEVQGFRKALTARVAELERITRQRDGITIERSAVCWKKWRGLGTRARAGNVDRDCS